MGQRPLVLLPHLHPLSIFRRRYGQAVVAPVQSEPVRNLSGRRASQTVPLRQPAQVAGPRDYRRLAYPPPARAHAFPSWPCSPALAAPPFCRARSQHPHWPFGHLCPGNDIAPHTVLGLLLPIPAGTHLFPGRPSNRAFRVRGASHRRAPRAGGRSGSVIADLAEVRRPRADPRRRASSYKTYWCFRALPQLALARETRHGGATRRAPAVARAHRVLHHPRQLDDQHHRHPLSLNHGCAFSTNVDPVRQLVARHYSTTVEPRVEDVAAADALYPCRPFAHHEGTEQRAGQKGAACDATQRETVRGEDETRDALPPRHVPAGVAPDRRARGVPQYDGLPAGHAHRR